MNLLEAKRVDRQSSEARVGDERDHYRGNVGHQHGTPVAALCLQHVVEWIEVDHEAVGRYDGVRSLDYLPMVGRNCGGNVFSFPLFPIQSSHRRGVEPDHEDEHAENANCLQGALPAESTDISLQHDDCFDDREAYHDDRLPILENLAALG